MSADEAREKRAEEAREAAANLAASQAFQRYAEDEIDQVTTFLLRVALGGIITAAMVATYFILTS